MSGELAASGGATSVALVRAGAEQADLGAWLDVHAADVASLLHRHGAVLFRGFATDSLAGFRAVRERLHGAPLAYGERSTPRSDLGEATYSSTDHPPSEPIALHNENSYTMEWPGRLLFGCLVAPAEGGSTPLADSRAVLRELPAELVAEFARRDWMLVRNYHAGVGLSWEETFGTADRGEVDAYCRARAVQAEWLDDGALRTRQVRPALARHPETRELVWFNHVRFFSSLALDPEVRELLTLSYGAEGLPYETRYGDGGAIDPEAIAAIAAAYDANTASFRWECGDVLLVDNMLMAHGRDRFSGPRRIVVSMGTPRSRRDCLAPAGAAGIR